MNYLSLFSGMECAHQAWAPLGWQCKAVAEIDPRACELLAYRLPDVPNLGSVLEITDEAIAALGPLDVVIGGSPCQDLSVAGKRAGLAGKRSSLFHEQLRIFHAAKSLCGARWLVWENVPGAFSSNAGRDFAVVAGALAGCELAVPRDGWGSEGMALGPHGLVEWSVLDAQWFGVAQRRRRVFAVLDTGNWTDRPPVLLEPDSLRGDFAPRREAGEVPAGAIRASAAQRGGIQEQDGASGLIPQAFGGGVNCKETDVSTAVGAHPGGYRLDFEAETFVAHTLRGDGFDASEDGTGRGTPLVAVAFAQNQRDEVREMDVAGALAAEPGAKQQTYIAFSCKDHAADAADDEAPTLRAMGHSGSHANAGGQVAVAFSIMPMNSGKDFKARETDIAQPVMASGPVGGNQSGDYIVPGMAVRRLTPRECERLQGVEDDWTAVPSGPRGKPMADGPRYKMLGNSFARPVITWIGQQIQIAHGWQA